MAVYIKCKVSGYVLDATEKLVKIQEHGVSHTSYNMYQLWMLQKEGNQVVLLNVGNGNVLDVDSNMNVITTEQRGLQPSERWIPDGNYYMKNMQYNLVLNIFGEQEIPGTSLTLLPQIGPPNYNQQFILTRPM